MMRTLIVVTLMAIFAASAAFRPQHMHISTTRISQRTPSNILPLQATKASAAADTEDDILIRRIQAEVFAESGVALDQLINPSKVVNLEREIMQIEKDLKDSSLGLTSADRDAMQDRIEKNRSKLLVEKRAVMRGWLKTVFVGQSVLAIVLSYLMAYNAVPGYQLPLSIQVMGFWMWWLFIVPSLRARKPVEREKDTLNLAFLATPLVSVLMPTFTKDVPTIWWANCAVVALCYAYGFLKPESGEEEPAEDAKQSNAVTSTLVKAFKALDYGSGQERGLRK